MCWMMNVKKRKLLKKEVAVKVVYLVVEEKPKYGEQHFLRQVYGVSGYHVTGICTKMMKQF